MPLRDKIDIFVSYTQPDQAWAEWVSWQLEQHGYNASLRTWDVAAGSDLRTVVDGALARSDLILAVVSPSYFDSPWATWELAQALARGTPLLPVRVADCELPDSWLSRDIHAVDLHGISRSEAGRDLLQAVQRRSKKVSGHADDVERIQTLLRRSSLGRSGARALSSRVSRDDALATVAASKASFIVLHEKADEWAPWVASTLRDSGFDVQMEEQGTRSPAPRGRSDGLCAVVLVPPGIAESPPLLDMLVASAHRSAELGKILVVLPPEMHVAPPELRAAGEIVKIDPRVPTKTVRHLRAAAWRSLNPTIRVEDIESRTPPGRLPREEIDLSSQEIIASSGELDLVGVQGMVVDLLESAPTFHAAVSRELLCRRTSQQLGINISVSDGVSRRLWFVNFVDACIRHPNGLAALVKAVARLERGSRLYLELARLVSEKDEVTRPHNLPAGTQVGDAAGAVAAFEQLLADRLRVLGPDHPDTLTTRSNLAYWRGQVGDAAGAVAAFEQLLADRLRVLGPDHPDTLTTRSNLAYWARATGHQLQSGSAG